MQLEIRYVTAFEFPGMVRESHNLLRACPATDASQRLVSYWLKTDPIGRVLTYTDHWGTRVDAFGVRQRHDRLELVADSVVETEPRPVPDAGPGMQAYHEDAFRTGHWQYLQPTRHTRWSDRVAAGARDLVGSAAGAVEAITAIHDGVRRELEYAPGATYVGMDINDVLDQGKGVCQDFAHLSVSMYRAVGIPARYVSGYFYAADQSVGAVPDHAEIEVQTHAWVEAAVPGWGWWALDPTNPEEVGLRHVKIGHGRDYDDVLPLRGVYHGGPEHTLDVSVRISREEMSVHQQQQAQQ
jgi:transglutaminase-like putative cysteine protease